MGKTLNADGWRGFKAIPGPDGKIAKSLCLLCNKEYNRVDHGFHNRHRTKTCPALKINGQNNSNLEENLVASTTFGSLEDLSSQKNSNLDSDSPARKRSRSTESLESGELSGLIGKPDLNKINILLGKLMVRFGISARQVQNFHFKSFCQAMNPQFLMPEADNLENNVIPKVYSEIISKNMQKDIMGIIIVENSALNDTDCNKIIHQNSLMDLDDSNEEEIHNRALESCLLSYALTSEMEYVFINAKVIENLNETSLKKFCDKSVSVLNTVYQIEAQFLLYNGDIELPDSGTINSVLYQRVRCYSALINLLKYNHEAIINENFQDYLKNSNYYKNIENLSEQITGKDFSTATQEVKKFIHKEELYIYDSTKTMVEEFMKPVHLASLFFNPISVDKLSDFEKNQVSRFLSLFKLKNTDYKFLSDYINRTGAFLYLFKDPIENPIQFWKQAFLQNCTVCQMALTILKIPAVVETKLDVAEIKTAIKNYENDDILKSLFISLIFEEKKNQKNVIPKKC